MTHRFFVRGLSVAIALGLFATFSSLVACTGSASSPAPVPDTNAPRATALDAAHQAYLEGDYVAMGERIRDVLLDPGSSDLAKENAYALLDKAYDVNHGKLPSRFTLPAGFWDLQFGETRGATQHGPFNKLFVWGRARDASRLTSLTLTRLPGEVLLDKASGKGKFTTHEERPGQQDFVLELQKVPSLPGDGVFTLRLELDDGTFAEGWFIAHGLMSSASPEIKSPSPSSSLSDPNPIVTWVPFRSPEYAPFEQRTLNVWLNRDGDESSTWSFWTGEPGDLASVRIGAQPTTPAMKLAAGDYWLSVTASELRNFGPISLNRGSQSVLPFHVVHAVH